jgi:hypothetical protein
MLSKALNVCRNVGWYDEFFLMDFLPTNVCLWAFELGGDVA